MATTSLWSVKGWLGKVVVYVEDPKKTENPAFYENPGLTDQQRQSLEDVIAYAADEEKTSSLLEGEDGVRQRFVTGINCSPLTAREEMLAVKKRFGKEDGVTAYHGYQSFAPGEATPELAHEIGVRLAKKLWGEKYQVLVATHLDKESHLHNHFVVNTVSFLDGIRYYRSEVDYRAMRRESDRLCQAYDLSVLPEKTEKGRTRQFGEWKAEQEERPTWRGIIKMDVDEAVSLARTDRQFFYHLRQKGYDIKFGKDITLRPPGKERGVKLARNFGPEYTQEAICRRILERSVSLYTSDRSSGSRGHNGCNPRLQGSRKGAGKIGGLRGLYLHYCFCLGAAAREKGSIARTHFLLREDLCKLDAISKEARFLCTNRIDTVEELTKYRDVLKAQRNRLWQEREQLRNRNRRERDPEILEKRKQEIRGLTVKIGGLRQELVLCEGIAVRSGVMKEKLLSVRQAERKEEGNREHRRRGSRADR